MMLESLTYESSPDEVAEALIAEMRRRGYSRDEAVGVIATGLQESGMQMVWSPNGLWLGHFQQDASYPNRYSPAGNIRGFLDRLDVKRKHAGHGDIWLNIFWLQQAPNHPSAQYAYDHGRQAYLTEIKSRATAATRLVEKYWGATQSEDDMPDNRPTFNEFPIWSDNNSPRNDVKVDAFLLHTQEGGGGDSAAENLAKWFKHANGVSYHYTISQASDGGVTVVDCVDTDQASWSVLSANQRSINLCFAGSRASWSREQWLKQGTAIDVAAYLAVEDCRKYGFPAKVVAPPYTERIPGISDHAYVTRVLGDGTHTDVGPNFPWDVFTAAVAKYAAEPAPPPAERTDRQLLQETFDQLRIEWPQLGGQTLVNALGEVRDKVCGVTDYAAWKAGQK